MNLTDNLQTAANLVLGKLQSWLETFVSMLPNLLVAIVVAVAFWHLGKLIGRGLRKGLRRVMDNAQAAGLVGTMASIGVKVAGCFIALSILQLDKAVTSLLAGVGIIGLALGFAFQDLAANFVSGVMMTVRNPFRVGDLVRIGEDMGVVEKVDLRTTSLRRLDGELTLIPNRRVYENTMINYARARSRRVEVAVGVSYDDDLEQAEEAATEALESLEMRVDGRPVDVFYTGFGGSSIDLICRFWIAALDQRSFVAARSEAIKAIKHHFDAAQISIPFPIRTLELAEPLAIEGVIDDERHAA